MEINLHKKNSILNIVNSYHKLLAKSYKQKAPSGFTLIELLIVLFVLSILGLVASQLFSNILKGTNKAQVIAEVKQNGQLISATLERHIRAAIKVCDNDPNDGCQEVRPLEQIFLTTTDGSTETLEFRPSCLPPCSPIANGQITLNGAPINNTNTVTGVDVAQAAFELLPQVEGAPQVVRVDITLNQAVEAPSRNDFEANVRLVNTYSLRTY